MPNPDTLAGSQASDSSAPSSFLQSPALLQFVKFCIVGVSNLAIDMGVANFLAFNLHVHWVVANTLSFIVAVSNSFYWNRRWTFGAHGEGNQTQRYILFIIINAIGLVIDLVIMKAAMFALTGEWHHELPPSLMIQAKLIATSVVVFWNFFANKRWTFKA